MVHGGSPAEGPFINRLVWFGSVRFGSVWFGFYPCFHPAVTFGGIWPTPQLGPGGFLSGLKAASSVELYTG